MKTIIFIVLLLFCVAITHAQEKSKLEIYTESGVYFPNQSSIISSVSDGVAVGAGLNYFKSLSDKFSIGLGIGYRYKENGNSTFGPDYDKLKPNTNLLYV